MKKPVKQKAKARGKTVQLKSKQHRQQTVDTTMRKVTVNLPEKLLEGTDLGTTELIREALKWYRHKLACETLLTMRGKFPDFGITWQELKEMRD